MERRRAGLPQEAPNKAEKFIGGILEEVPFLQDVLTYVSRPFSAIAGLAEAGINVAQGRGSAALDRLEGAGRSLAGLLDLPPVTALTGFRPSEALGIGPRPQDFRSGVDVLRTAGVPKLGSVDLPLIGKVSGRGALGFGLDVATDPLTFTRFGGLTKAGVAARSSGNVRKLAKPLRGSQFAGEAELGQRALVQVYGKPLIRDIPLPERLGGSALGLIENARTGIAKAFGPLVASRNPLIGRFRDLAVKGGRLDAIQAEREFATFWKKTETTAKELGISPERAAEILVGTAERSKGARLGGNVTQRAELAGTGLREVAEQVQEQGRLGRRVPPQKPQFKIPETVEHHLQTARAHHGAEGARQVNALLDDLQKRHGISRDEAAKRVNVLISPVGDLKGGFRLAVEIPPPSARGPIAKVRAPTVERSALTVNSIEAVRTDIRARIKKMTKKGPGGVPEMSVKEAIRAIRVMDTLGVDEAMAPLVGGYLKFFKEMFGDEQRAGVAIAVLSDSGINYVAHVLTPEAKALLGTRELERLSQAGFWGKMGSQRTRKVLEGHSVPEVTEWVKTNQPDFFAKLASKADELIEKGERIPLAQSPVGLFETNPVRLAAIRARRSGFAKSGGAFLRDIGHQYGRKLTAAEAAAGGYVPLGKVMQDNNLRGWRTATGGDANLLIEQEARRLVKAAEAQQVPLGIEDAITQARASLQQTRDIVPTSLAGVEKLSIPADIADDVARTFTIRNSPATSSKFLQLTDKITQIWKTAVTVPFPEFHARNAFSNWWANYLGGVVNPVHYKDALDALLDFRKAAKGGGRLGRLIDVGKGRTMSVQQLFDEMESAHFLGFGGTGQAELGKGINLAAANPLAAGISPGRRAGRAALFAPRALAKGGRFAGELIEDHAKIAHVLGKMRQGFSVDEAILSAKRYLFDYSELTGFEKTVMRRIVPFYTWMRKNLPLQIESVLTQPGKVAAVAKFQHFLQQEAEGLDGTVDTSMVPDYIRRRLFGLSPGEDGEIKILSGLGIGLEDLGIFDRPALDFLSSLNPLIKGPLQSIVGKDFYRDSPLDRAEVAPRVFQFFGAVPGGKQFLDAIDFRMVKDKNGDERWARANPLALNLLSSLPLAGASSRFSNVFSRFLSGRESDPNALVRSIAGVQVRPFNKEAQMQQQMRTMLEYLNEQLDEKLREGTGGRFEVDFLRRDILPASPEALEFNALRRQKTATLKALKRITLIQQQASRGGLGG